MEFVISSYLRSSVCIFICDYLRSKMRYGIFSDVHGNLEAFETVLDYYKNKVDTFIYLGDIVGYGANPRECLALLKSLDVLRIAGNHDWAVIGKLDIEYFNPYAKAALLWTRENLKQDDILCLQQAKITHKADEFMCVHGSIDKPQEFNYIWNINDAWENFLFLKKKICFIGHSHKTEVYFLERGRIFHSRAPQMILSGDRKYIINVGSVGQPRDGDRRASLCIYNSDDNAVTFKRLEYNIDKAADKILRKGLPPILASRLYRGW